MSKLYGNGLCLDFSGNVKVRLLIYTFEVGMGIRQKSTSIR
jgi:hypothetical protein